MSFIIFKVIKFSVIYVFENVFGSIELSGSREKRLAMEPDGIIIRES
jgi:hypothetical protein